MMGITPQERAQWLVAENAHVWERITNGDINLRRMLLEELFTEPGANSSRQRKFGLPELYLISCARQGDKAAYDLLSDMGVELDFDRPKAPGGVDANAARDFVVYFLSVLLMYEFPELCPGANDATPEGVSAVDMIRKAIEDAGLGCIDYRAQLHSAPAPRSMERAVRRFREKRKYRELFWPEVDAHEESCHTQYSAVLSRCVCTETSSDGGTDDTTGTTALGYAAHDPVALTPICPNEGREIPQAPQARPPLGRLARR